MNHTPSKSINPVAIIADDEPLLRTELRTVLAKLWPELNIAASVSNGKQAVNAVKEHRAHVAFLDVQMPHMTGLQAAEQIKGDCHVVFVTAYDKYALAAFEQRAVDYLVKPLEIERLAETVERLKTRFSLTATGVTRADFDLLATELRRSLLGSESAMPVAPAESTQRIKVASGNSFKLIEVSEIACFRAIPGYTQVVTVQGVYLISEPLKTLIEKLDSKHFMQVHRSAIVNLQFVSKIARPRAGQYMIELKHDLGQIEVSRARAGDLRNL
jgi:DNA-binding LytR/AlgR family response regulator